MCKIVDISAWLNPFLSLFIYSGTSDKGPSEIGTKSLQGTLVSTPCYTLVYSFTFEIGTTSLQGTLVSTPC